MGTDPVIGELQQVSKVSVAEGLLVISNWFLNVREKCMYNDIYVEVQSCSSSSDWIGSTYVRYLACRADFDLGLRDVALAVLRACCACLLAYHAWRHPLYQTVLRPLVPPGTTTTT